MSHPAIIPGAVAVVTGGASGIGLAAAERFARAGLRVCIVDTNAAALKSATATLEALAPGGASDIFASHTDVSSRAELDSLASEITKRWGGTDILMNNAGIQPGSAIFGPEQAWTDVIAVNLMGIVHGTRAFVPGMIARGRPGLVINTGSKQGITTPPGDPAYNVAKAGVKAFTEALAHELRNTDGCDLTAHLLIPGFVYTNLTKGSRTEKPAAAWTAEQTADFMLDSLERGDFYILCPDNDVPRSLDEKRIAWAAGDIIENRAALSRWHPDYGDAFAEYLSNT